MRFVNHQIFRWAKEPWFGFHAPRYEPDLIEQLKSVPIRAWDPQEKTWWYPSQFFPVVEATCAAFFVNEMDGGRYLNFLATAPSTERNKVLDVQVKRSEATLAKIKMAIASKHESTEGKLTQIEYLLGEIGL